MNCCHWLSLLTITPTIAA
ncbi:hypothetical protein LINPERHAP2_LOCUS23367 [Linum perenne]